MSKNFKKLEAPAWIALALLVGFLCFSAGVLWEGRVGAGMFALRVSPGYEPLMAASAEAPAGRIDINTASALELADLPGIGAVLAQRIVDYREEHGPFASPEDLTGVSGIGEAKLSRIIPYIQIIGGAG